MAARKLVVYSDMRKELAVFEENYKSIIPDCSNPKGMQSAKDCRKEIRDARLNLEDLRKEAKAPTIAKGKVIDKEAAEIKEKLDALYSKFDDSIKAIENKKEIDAAKARKKQEDKEHELEAREQAIFDKEVELGLRKSNSDYEKLLKSYPKEPITLTLPTVTLVVVLTFLLTIALLKATMT